MKKQNIEVEGGELLIMSKEGHYAVIPAKHRQELIDMIKDGCDDCINKYIQTLPKDSDYAEDGSLIIPDDKNEIKKEKVTINSELIPIGNTQKDVELLGSKAPKIDIKKEIETSNKTERDFMHTPQYLRLLETEYEVPYQNPQLLGNKFEIKKAKQEQGPTSVNLKNMKLEKLDNLKYEVDSKNVPENSYGHFNRNNNTIEIGKDLDISTTSLLSHEREHGTELDIDIPEQNIPGTGFQKKLFSIYQNKGLVNPDIKIRSKDTPEYIMGEELPKDSVDPRSKLPKIEQYPTWNSNAGKYYINTEKGEQIIGDEIALYKYFDENYKGLFTDNKNWVNELKDYKEMGADKGSFKYINNSNIIQNQLQNEVIKNKIPKGEQEAYIQKRTNEILTERRSKYDAFRKNKYLFPNDNNEELQSDPKYNSTRNPEYDNTNSIFDVMPQGYKLEGFEDKFNSDKLIPSEQEGKEFYYYSPIEVKARLKAIRDHAVKNGFKIGDDIKPFLKNINDEGIRLQYEDLIKKTGLDDNEINELMNYFAHLNSNNNSNTNNIV